MIDKIAHIIGLVGFVFCLETLSGSGWTAALARWAYFLGSILFAVLVAADWLTALQ